MKHVNLLIIIFSLTLQGCVGGMLLYEKSETFYPSDFYLEDISVCKLKRAPYPGESDKQYLSSSCEQPTEINTNGVNETWRYVGYDGWSGIVAFAIIPIPLILPSGHRDTIIKFNHEQLVSVEKQSSYKSIAFCGVAMLHSVEFGCGAGKL